MKINLNHRVIRGKIESARRSIQSNEALNVIRNLGRNKKMEQRWSIRNYIATFVFIFFLILTFFPSDYSINAIGWGGAISTLLAGFD